VDEIRKFQINEKKIQEDNSHVNESEDIKVSGGGMVRMYCVCFHGIKTP
jgi:hypothetical protein